ncbi:MAG: LysM peptidoglycan-binding domain-containing protein [Microbacterium hominis]|nr:LysM peptidoglycan-binding domain-containing protein [Microbacterium hominis]
MTTIDILGASPRRAVLGAAPATRLRLTRRGRRVLAFLASVPAIVALSIAIISGGGALATSDSGAGAAFEKVTVMPGDTLWSIAESVAPQAHPRDVVDAIMRLNALPSGSLDAGETIAIPLEYSAAR